MPVMNTAPIAPAPAPTAPPAPSTMALTADRVRAEPPLLVAIGDLHGDLAATRRALRLAGAIDEADRWAGGSLVVVQTGDCIDRGNEDRGVLDLLQRVRDEALRAGGELILLNGNHELMNVANDLRYVTPQSMAQFDDLGGRATAFLPEGPYARLLGTHPLFVKVGDSVFVHGGILSKHVAYGLDRMDGETRAWIRGELPSMPEPVAAADGVVWTRIYSADPLHPAACAELRNVLDQLGAKRMVVGHTVQLQGINAACEGLVWRIDVGLSKYYGGPMQVLEIGAGGVLRVRQEQAAPQPTAPTPAPHPAPPAATGVSPH
jgi:hypothetical protein